MIPVYKASDKSMHVRFLGVKTLEFSDWFKRSINKLPFKENEDYWKFEEFPYSLLENNTFSPELLESQSKISKDLVLPNGSAKSLPQTKQHGVEQKDYILTLDTAKELAMIDKSEKGREVVNTLI
jgi:phage anti-repressor protein